MTQAKLTIGELEALPAVLQSPATIAPTRQDDQRHRTHGLLGTSGNAQPMPANALQGSVLPAGSHSSGSGKSKKGKFPFESSAFKQERPIKFSETAKERRDNINTRLNTMTTIFRKEEQISIEDSCFSVLFIQRYDSKSGAAGFHQLLRAQDSFASNPTEPARQPYMLVLSDETQAGNF